MTDTEQPEMAGSGEQEHGCEGARSHNEEMTRDTLAGNVPVKKHKRAHSRNKSISGRQDFLDEIANGGSGEKCEDGDDFKERDNLLPPVLTQDADTVDSARVKQPRDETDALPASLRYNAFDFLCSLISMLTYAADVAMDCVVAYYFYHLAVEHGIYHYWYFGLTLVFIVLPSLTMTGFSFRWYLMDSDNPGLPAVGPLRWLVRSLRFRLERGPGETGLIDRTGRALKMEPLATVRQLEKYLLKMVAKQWYDFERSTFNFVRQLEEGSTAQFTHQSDFDTNGLLYWIGTNGGTATDWVNPAQYGLVVVTSSEGRNLPYGKLEDILSREPAALNCHTNDDRRAWFAIDLGVWLEPSSYTLRHARGYGRSAVRTWQLQGSRDGLNWEVLSDHSGDERLGEPGSTATWSLRAEPGAAYRHIRLQQLGRNASGQTHYLSLSGFEIYGRVAGTRTDRQAPVGREQLPGSCTTAGLTWPGTTVAATATGWGQRASST